MVRRRRRENYAPKMRTLLVLVMLAAGTTEAAFAPSSITVEPDGGYAGIVVRIVDSVPEDQCAALLANLQVGKCYDVPNLFGIAIHNAGLSAYSISGKTHPPGSSSNPILCRASSGAAHDLKHAQKPRHKLQKRSPNPWPRCSSHQKRHSRNIYSDCSTGR